MIAGWRIGALALSALVWCAPALAENRLALVIGNSSYRAVTPLPNPVNDAKAMSGELRSASFDVTEALDLGQSDMRRAIRDFAGKIAAKGTDTVALVFYAGHGVQVDGENFLVPVDARIQRESDIAIESVRLADVMNALAAVPSKMRIVILDACRNNPFATGKQTKGLAIVDAPTGSIVAYSTAPGTEATDGSGADSPYTSAFLEVAKEPHLQIEQLFKQVRLKVHEATKGQQTPWESSSLTSDFWFFPVDSPAPAPNAAVAAVSAAPMAAHLPPQRQTPVASAAPTPPTPSVPPTTAQPITQAAVQPAAQPATPAPDSFAPSAPRVASAPVAPPPAGYAPAGYAPPQPGAYAPPQPVTVADMRMMSPDDAYAFAIEQDTVAAYEEFLLLFPSDPRADWVRTTLALRVDALAWRYAVLVNTPAAYANYIALYPGGVYVGEAMRLRLQPRLRPIDTVIAPRVVVAPVAPRIALPLIQRQRPAGPIVLPVVLRPGHLERARWTPPGGRVPGGNPAFAPRFNTFNNQRFNTFNGNTATLPPGPGPQFRRPFVNQPPAPGHPPVAYAAPNVHPVGPVGRPVNQFRPGMQRVQLGAKPKLPPKCEGKGCRR
ncbi:MAG TPA: caspase family protein [Xanthobacteraceae bacterium]|nr:caspase family protein [Xanthobacteraceae bacterium]